MYSCPIEEISFAIIKPVTNLCKKYQCKNKQYWRMKTLFLLTISIVSIFADELSDCKCNEGFTTQSDENGGVYCHGVVLKSILPCNITFKPDCVCSSDATSVVQDSSGTWCGRFIDGKEDKRWECENKEEWIAFYADHPEEMPKARK
ncbi:hypothetical protein JTB14_020855 [Gonioctena quinquepunctata]|nr:hypothetical protein JTB14_020855 [Gonioctena quinquepunctata]